MLIYWSCTWTMTHFVNINNSAVISLSIYIFIYLNIYIYIYFSLTLLLLLGANKVMHGCDACDWDICAACIRSGGTCNPSQETTAAAEMKRGRPRNTVQSNAHEKYSCSECTQEFTREKNLTTHMRTHTERQIHACSKCGQEFTERDRLATHMRTHTREKMFSCSECTHEFKHEKNLTTHMRTHTEGQIHACSKCGQEFTERDRLATHMRIHMRECAEGFTQPTNRYLTTPKQTDAAEGQVSEYSYQREAAEGQVSEYSYQSPPEPSKDRLRAAYRQEVQRNLGLKRQLDKTHRLLQSERKRSRGLEEQLRSNERYYLQDRMHERLYNEQRNKWHLDLY